MINPFTQINWKPSDREIRKFGLTLFIGFMVIAILIAGVSICGSGTFPSRPVLILIFAGIIVFLLTLSLPKLALPLYYLWFFLSACIGIVVSNLILMLFYYLLFSPFSITVRYLSGRDPLQLKKDMKKNSRWVERKGGKSLKSYLKQY